MLSHLMASAPERRGLTGVPGTTISLFVHAALVLGAVMATKNSAFRITSTSAMVVDLPALPDEPTRPSERVVTAPVISEPVISAPIDIPTVIPPVDSSKVWRQEVYLRTRIADPVPDVLVRTTETPGGLFRDVQVDEHPEQLVPFSPVYPDLLRQAGIEGTVVIEVIVDTTGRAEPQSLRVVQAANHLFEVAAREAVLKTVYRPGRVNGAAVRVLVQVPISFAIRR